MEKQKAEKLERVSSPELDKVLGLPFKVLDDGFVRVVDYMGSDTSIVQAARVSYGKGTKSITDDRTLLRYLIRNRHTSPFEMCEIKLHVRVPMDCWRQWIRHRTANVNEYSTRYSIAIDSAYKTEPDAWRKQALKNRQGSEGFFDEKTGAELSAREREMQKAYFDEYKRKIDMGVAREQARKDLPLSTYTEAYWKIDLGNLLHFLELRMEPKAQHEIRMYSNVICDEILKRWTPFTWEAFKDYKLDAITLSKTDEKMIAVILKNNPAEAEKLARTLGYLQEKDGETRKSRECLELEEKLARLSLKSPFDK